LLLAALVLIARTGGLTAALALVDEPALAAAPADGGAGAAIKCTTTLSSCSVKARV
jgi:hypothetical protein